MHGGLPDVCRNGQRERQPARAHLSDAGRDRRPAGAVARGAPASGTVPRLPGLRDGLPLGRAIRQADRAVSRGDGATGDGAAKIERLVSSLDPVSAVSVSRADAGRDRAGAVGAAAGAGSRWPKTLGLLRLLPPRLRQLVEMLPPLRQAASRRCRSSCRRSARGGPAWRCSPAAWPTRCFARRNWATARVLQQNGCDVIVPRDQACCGAIHFHAGAQRAGPAVCRRERGGVRLDDVDAVIVNVAGCGAMLKDYGHHWHDERQPARERVRRQGQGRQRVSRSAGADRAAGRDRR